MPTSAPQSSPQTHFEVLTNSAPIFRCTLSDPLKSSESSLLHLTKLKMCKTNITHRKNRMKLFLQIFALCKQILRFAWLIDIRPQTWTRPTLETVTLQIFDDSNNEPMVPKIAVIYFIYCELTQNLGPIWCGERKRMWNRIFR